MKRGDRGPVALLMATSVFLGAAVYFASPAKADVTASDVNQYRYAVCSVLDDSPSIASIIGMGLALGDEGYSGYDAGQIIGYAVLADCPEYGPLLQEFAEMFSETAA